MKKILILDEKRFILQGNYYDQIEISKKIDVYKMYDDYSKLEKDELYNISNVYNADGKIGLIINNDLVTDIKYTKIEAIETCYTYWASDELIIPANKFIAWKLYVDDRFYILTDIVCSDEYFDALSENIFISKNSYKDMNIIETENEYVVYGIDDTDKENKLYDVEKIIDREIESEKKHMQNNQNYYSYFLLLGIFMGLIIIVCVTKIRKSKKS